VGRFRARVRYAVVMSASRPSPSPTRSLASLGPHALLVLAGCSGGAAETVPWLDVPAEVVSEAAVGERHTLTVPVTNSGTASGRFDASVSAPFETSGARYAIDPDQTVSVQVFVDVDRAEPIDGSLDLVLGSETWVVPLEVQPIADADGDGFAAASAGGDDCDDADPDRYPGADERCDGVDDDCDGVADNDLPAIEQWPDDDGDGYGDGSAPSTTGCAVAAGAADNDDDCDDADPQAFPGADEVWYDGVDQGCDGGSDYDQDADGFDRIPEGDDCDDLEPLAYPGADEVADGIDNDCDAARDEDTVVAGELVVTELFPDPDTTTARWVELHNPGTTTVDLLLVDIDIDGEVSALPERWLGPGEVVLLCSDADDVDNGGLGCDAEVAAPDGFRLVRLLGPDGEVEAVDASGWSVTVGRALELSAGAYDAAVNDDEASWCVGVSLFGDDSGDRGTPGALLPPC